VNLLLQRGANPEAKFKGQLNPIDIAKANHHQHLVTLLTTNPRPSVTSALSSTSLSSGNDGKHLLFFSYSKIDTVAETTILTEKAKTRFPGSSIFRDADSKFKLSELITHIHNSKNVIVLLSGNYPKRPYTLIELHHALKSGLSVHLVKVTREGMVPFDFDQVLHDIETKAVKSYLDEKGWSLLQENGISMAQVCADLKQVMDVRAFDFSVSFSLTVQAAMIEDILNAFEV